MEKGENHGITVLYPKEGSAATVNDVDITFDLVAIHGLAGDPFATWTHVKAQQMWLQDLLPQAMPNVRIMTFGYNASFRNVSAKHDIRSIAAKLLAELTDLRGEKAAKRPIILLCHSLGGIVAKQALLLEPSLEHVQVQEAVHGIIFLATPHRGSSLAAYGKTLATITKYCSPLNPPTALLDALRQDSQRLLKLTADFAAKSSHIQIASFYEMKLTRIGLMRKMVVTESSAVLNLPNETRIPSNADHRQIARFPSLHDRNFRPLLKRLEVFEAQILKNMRSVDVLKTPRGTATSSCLELNECLSAPCDTFNGRETVLDHIKEYFNHRSVEESERLSFALCGFGGLGKTQVALKYANAFREQYTGGVFFLLARSESTIAADLQRICESLGLIDGSNNASMFKRWLASRENKNYLLVLDNADDLTSDLVSSFIPNVPWGHLLYTSRDQGIIGTLAQSGMLLDHFTPQEAVQVLLHKAGVLHKSEDDLDLAHQIVHQFGCLPLAIDQAGAYMKARNKSLSAFQKLCSQRQSEILKYKPRLAQYEQTVFTTWDMNFGQVEALSEDAWKLVLLFCYLDPSNIHEAMLDRGCSGQKRWSRDGEVVEMLSSESGVDEDLARIIQDDLRFDDAVEVLKSYSLIYTTEDDHTGLRIFSMHPMIQYCASERVVPEIQNHWRAQAIALICHAFPVDETLDPFYFSAGIVQLPHARRILSEWRLLPKNDTVCSKSYTHIAGLYVRTSRFGNITCKSEAIAQAKECSKEVEDIYLSALIAGRESSLLRMKDEFEKSSKIIQDAITEYARRKEAETLPQAYNAQIGKLIQSQAENLIYSGELDTAQWKLQNWNPSDKTSPSSMEKAVQISIGLTLGRLSKIRGHFEKALSQLNPVLERMENEEIDAGGWRRVLIATIGELYCELGRPSDAQSPLVSELDLMKITRVENVNSGLRLQVVLAESYLRDGSFQKSQEVARSVKDRIERHSGHSSITRRFHLRAWAILARTAHMREDWDEALSCWGETLKILGLMRATGPKTAIVDLSIALALQAKSNVFDSSDRATLAWEKLEAEKCRRYHYTGFDSYWRDEIVSKYARWRDAGASNKE